MSKQLLLEEKHHSLKRALNENLRKKHFVEMSIREELEELKKLEASLEKMQATRDEQVSTDSLRILGLGSKSSREFR